MSHSTERNLLVGLLAFQNELVDREAVLAAMKCWMADKSRSLEEILLAQGTLGESQWEQLNKAVERHLQTHGEEPAAGLGSLHAATTLHQDLASLADRDVLSTLACITPERGTIADAAPDPAETSASQNAGRFRVLREHARGGLGKVQLAVDEELQREVALKEIQSRFASDQSLRRRFVLEAEITGRLEHPGVVPVYGLGAYPDGRPYYAMRFIKGESMRQAIEKFHAAEQDATRDPSERALTLRKLLGRFVAVCNAVEYAHSRGVLHRDLKPDNFMLGDYGETLVVDWGLAKLLDRVGHVSNLPGEVVGHVSNVPAGLKNQHVGNVLHDDDATVLGEAIGTPAYMSPEQSMGRHDELTPASDVYSLGATLYSLLTGKPAFRSAKVSDVLQQVQDGDFPKPQQLNPRVPPALAAICLKAMARQAPDRYPSARALADEIESWLADEPVKAYPEPWSVRTGRWLRRHKTVVVGTGATAAAMLLGLFAVVVVLAISNQRVNRERKRAEENFDLARQSVDQFLVRVSDDSRLKQHGLAPLRRELLATAGKFYEQLAEKQGTDARLRAEQGRAYFRLAGITGEIGSTEKEVEQLQSAISIFGPLTAAEPNKVEYQDLYVAAHNNLGLAYTKLGRHKLAQGAYETAAKRGEELTKASPKEAIYHSNLATTHSKLGVLYLSMSKRDEAHAEFLAAANVFELLRAEVPRDLWCRRELAAARHNLALIHRDEGEMAEAEAAFNAALKIIRECQKDEPEDLEVQMNLALFLSSRAAFYWKLNRLAEAELGFLESISVRAPLLRVHTDLLGLQTGQAVAEGNLGSLYDGQDRLIAADEYLRRSVATLENVVEKEGSNPITLDHLASGLAALARVCARLGKYDEGREILARAVLLREQLVALQPGVTSYEASLAAVLSNHGIEQANSQRFAEAARSYDRARAICKRLVDLEPRILDHQELSGRLERNIGSLRVQTGELDRAETALHAAKQIQEKLAAEHSDRPGFRSQLAQTRQAFAQVQVARGRQDLAEGEHRAAIEIYKALQMEFPELQNALALGSAYNRLGMMFLAAESYTEAESEFRSALAVFEEMLAIHTESPALINEIIGCQQRLATIYSTVRRHDEAADALDGAIAARRKLVEAFPEVPQYRFYLCQDELLAGWVAFNAERSEVAADHYDAARDEALLLLEAQPDSLEGRVLLGQVEHNRGMLFMRTEDLDEAQLAFRAAADVRAAVRADNPGEIRFAADLTWSHLQLAGVSLLARDYKAALAWSDKSFESSALISQAESKTQALVELMQAVHGVKGKVLFDSGEPEKALVEWNAAIALLPETTNAELLFGRVETLAKLGEYAKAIADAQRVKGPLAHNWNDLLLRTKTAAEIATRIRADENLSEAKREERAKQFDDLAIQLLQFGEEAGYLSVAARRGLVAKEPAFVMLREREEFKRLVE